jgi:hypothetical protein
MAPGTEGTPRGAGTLMGSIHPPSDSFSDFLALHSSNQLPLSRSLGRAVSEIQSNSAKVKLTIRSTKASVQFPVYPSVYLPFLIVSHNTQSVLVSGHQCYSSPRKYRSELTEKTYIPKSGPSSWGVSFVDGSKGGTLGSFPYPDDGPLPQQASFSFLRGPAAVPKVIQLGKRPLPPSPAHMAVLV